VYPFENVNFDKVKMYFPVPYNVDWNTVKVYVNEKPVKWRISDWKYETIIGEYPVIEWTIFPLPNKFNVTVVYEQEVEPLSDGSFKILYAMATGRFLNQTYAKQCVAEVKVAFGNLPPNFKIKIASVPPPGTFFENMYSTEVEVEADCCGEVIFRKASKPFEPLKEDILITAFPAEIEEKWIPYTPDSESVDMELEIRDNEVNVTVSITFRHSGFKVAWGDVTRQGNKFIADAEIYEWTGPVLQVITTKKHTYNLGKLKPGSYKFEFKVNGVKLKEISFTVASSSTACTGALPPLILAIAATLALARFKL